MIQADPKFTKQIQDWLNKSERSDDDILAGAQLLRDINPKNITYRRWLQLAATRPQYIVAHIERELNTHLKYRLDGLTLEQVNRLDRIVIPAAEKLLGNGVPVGDDEEEGDDGDMPKRLGRRDDHEQLPDEIKQLWTSNGELYKNIKATFEELKSMEDIPSCQRYDKLSLLDEMDKKYIDQMARYDAYVIPKTQVKAQQDPQAPSCSSKDVANARSYISKNIGKLEDIAKEKGTDSKGFSDLKTKISQRFDIITSAGEPMGEELVSRLAAVGISIKSEEETVFEDDKKGPSENDSPSAGKE